ncbi:hypothetical protein CE91St43_05400 [Oscillospiraceae bacterium]|nr:hypothetical protein CE91St43_05400 [Oscillospiraceae bacterium]
MDNKTKALLDRAPEIVAAVLCDKTMECCGKAKQCPYHSTDYNHISIGYGCDVDRLDADTAGLLKAYATQLAAVTVERDGAVAFIQHIDKDYGRYISDAGFERWRGPQGAGEAANE